MEETMICLTCGMDHVSADMEAEEFKSKHTDEACPASNAVVKMD